MTPADMLSAIECEHPSIAARLAAIWGEPECADYLRRLLVQDREARAGFSLPVFSALAGLQELHDLLYAMHPEQDVWGIAA